MLRTVVPGIGVTRPEDIEIVADDEAGKQYSEMLKGILSEGWKINLSSDKYRERCHTG